MLPQLSTWMNERLKVRGQSQAIADGVTDWERPTTEGEVVKTWGYMVLLSLNPSVPVEEMWRRKPRNRAISSARPTQGGMAKRKIDSRRCASCTQ